MDKFIAGVLIGALIVTATVFILVDSAMKEHVVKKGHGEYNRTSGEFQFLPACKKETK